MEFHGTYLGKLGHIELDFMLVCLFVLDTWMMLVCYDYFLHLLFSSYLYPYSHLYDIFSDEEQKFGSLASCDEPCSCCK